ncbi:aspartate dehydrogenase domain-containing protein [Paeniglutamicibacter cryotolerans]|uniref:L-aspartate dehydrogenase n=1 Tax=Paeniglutamicibacter cryotolerans TaxID=670079 RepID=A0A839QMV7_9MICC|nr:aspartate dehydrogenase domain-containing protein [Paeniglutamicibacter cryotolerans]MBB2996923.1 aspartate dehydrogenase [Paeniglutamicibacter cryotolerans]
MVLKVALLGYGAIGREVRRMLLADGGSISMTGVIARGPLAGGEPGEARDGLPGLGLEEALERADLVIECASATAVREHGPRIIASGTDLLIASIGALANPPLRRALTAGPGRAHLSTGAIGGLDLLRAAALDGGLERVTLSTTKAPAALINPGMDPATRSRIEAAAGPTEIFAGTVAEAVLRFPRNINVAAALALAVGDFAMVRVRILADPVAALTLHRIEAEGSAGKYAFDVANAPDPLNPATSALTARSIVAGVHRLSGRRGSFHFI